MRGTATGERRPEKSGSRSISNGRNGRNREINRFFTPTPPPFLAIQQKQRPANGTSASMAGLLNAVPAASPMRSKVRPHCGTTSSRRYERRRPERTRYKESRRAPRRLARESGDRRAARFGARWIGICGRTSPAASSASDAAGHAVPRAGRVLAWPSCARAAASVPPATAAGWQKGQAPFADTNGASPCGGSTGIATTGCLRRITSSGPPSRRRRKGKISKQWEAMNGGHGNDGRATGGCCDATHATPKAPLARHVADRMGQAHGSGGGGVSTPVPSVRRRHPAHRVTPKPGSSDSET